MEQAPCHPGGTGQQRTHPPRKPLGVFPRVPGLVVPLPRVSLEGQGSELACLAAACTPQPRHAAGAGSELLLWTEGEGCSVSLVMLSTCLIPGRPNCPKAASRSHSTWSTNRAVPYFPGEGAGSPLSCWEGVRSRYVHAEVPSAPLV